MKKIVSNLSAALLIGALVFTTSCKKEVVVTANKASVAIGEDVTFNCIESSSDKGKLKSTNVSWDFGDEAQTSGTSTSALDGSALRLYNNNNRLQVVHSFNAAGTYTVAAIFNKSKKPTKKNGRSSYGTVEITVNALTSTLAVKDANGVDVTAVMDAQELTLSVTNDQTTMAQAAVAYEWFDNGVSQGTTSNKFMKLDATGGKHTYRVKTIQGATSSWSNEIVVTVAGEVLSVAEMQAMIGGKWNISFTANGAGLDYGTSFPVACGAGPFTATSQTITGSCSSLYLNANGNSTWDVTAMPANQTGNLNTGLGNYSFTVVNSTTITVNGFSWNGHNNENGAYTCTFSATGMTLTRKFSDGSATGCQGAATYTDTYTITMSR